MMRTCALAMLVLVLGSCDRRDEAKPPPAASTKPGGPGPAVSGEVSYYAAPGGKTVGVSGTVIAIAQLPKRRSPLYRDALIAVRVGELTVDGAPLPGREMLAYGWGLRETAPTRLSTVRAGERVTLKVQPWAAVARRLESIPKSELPGTGEGRAPMHFAEIE